jgi:hypothetical protein
LVRKSFGNLYLHSWQLSSYITYNYKFYYTKLQLYFRFWTDNGFMRWVSLSLILMLHGYQAF